MRNRKKAQAAKERNMRRDLKFQLWGWILFTACALFYIVSSIVNRDWITFAGSFLFLVACIVFMIPLVVPAKKS